MASIREKYKQTSANQYRFLEFAVNKKNDKKKGGEAVKEGNKKIKRRKRARYKKNNKKAKRKR